MDQLRNSLASPDNNFKVKSREYLQNEDKKKPKFRAKSLLRENEAKKNIINSQQHKHSLSKF